MSCCICKTPLALLAVVGIAIGAAVVSGHGPEDKKPAAQPKAETPKKDEKPAEPKPATDPYVLGYSMNRIDGTKEDLSIYRGKVVLIVNVASHCGYTKQYDGLEKLYESKKNDGFVILGFPANEFGKQEPGSNTEIKEFCSSKFNVSFPMFEKIVVKGEGIAPLYQKLASQPAPIGGPPKWNFTKFLVDRNGNVVARYESAVKPDDKDLIARIDELLKAKADATSEPKGVSPRQDGK